MIGCALGGPGAAGRGWVDWSDPHNLCLNGALPVIGFIVGHKGSRIPPESDQMSPRSSSGPDGYDLNTALALFRYGLIPRQFHDLLPSGHQERSLRHIAAKTYAISASTRSHVSVTPLCRYLAL